MGNPNMPTVEDDDNKHDADSFSPPYYSKSQPWDRAAEAYASTVARSSRRAAPHLITMAQALWPLDQGDAAALELGAGTGPLTLELRERFPQLALLATDISPGMIAELKAATDNQYQQQQHSMDKTTPSPSPPLRTAVLDMTPPLNLAVVGPPGTFSHVFCMGALQSVGALATPALRSWLEVLRPGGVLAVGVWDYDRAPGSDVSLSAAGPNAIWTRAARHVYPAYQDVPDLPPGSWNGGQRLAAEMHAAGLNDIRVERRAVGFDLGTEAFLDWFWHGGNPATVDRIASFGQEGLEDVRDAMKHVLHSEYADGKDIPLWTALAVGRKAAL